MTMCIALKESLESFYVVHVKMYIQKYNSADDIDRDRNSHSENKYYVSKNRRIL
jgi:hypothetical protein